MALKDWKLEKTRRGLIKWTNLYKQEYIVIDKVKPMGSADDVYEVMGTAWINNRYFVTKSQALKFAKSYMKKN